MSKQLYLFANWKMYLNHDESVALAEGIKGRLAHVPANIKMAVFPTALSLRAVKDALNGIPVAVGAQNFHWVAKAGATGEISAEMFRAVGCSYALAGHSERRHLFKESNHDVRQKLEAALAAGLTPVVCVGETLAERRDGQTVEAVEAQVRAAFSDIVWPEGREPIVAYEPVWAIGTGEACEPEQAEEVASLINKFVCGLVTGSPPIILYGGSVRENNVAAYINQPHLQGVLVGGASTKLESWADIIQVVSQ